MSYEAKFHPAKTSAELAAEDPHIGQYEIAVASDTGEMKVGPGRWSELTTVGPAVSEEPPLTRILEEPFATTEVAGETVSPLAFDVEAGHWYYITGIFYWQNGGADAMPVSFNGGTATVESFLANVGAGGNNSVFTGTDPSESTGSADDDVRPLAISVKFDGSGTFAPLLTRSGLSGQAILGIGSTWTMTDITPSE